MLTYKSLYSLVNDQIKKRIHYNTTAPYTSDNQSSRTDVEPFMMPGSGRRDMTANELIEAMQTLLDEALPNNIIEGLEVTATDPISNAIVISAGHGTAGGVMYTLEENTTIAVPFDAETEIFYITLYKDVIRFDKKEDTKRLKLAKIVIPKPGITNKIKDRRADNYPWDAYIVNFHKYELYGIYDTFEEDTVDLLRDNIGQILADNLIGNLRLSEQMTISNTAGTLLLDSQSVQIKDSDGNVMAKFNQNGTFFYDSDGVEVAKFGVDEARIGNIKVTKNTIESGVFVSGTKGFRISDSGKAEFEDVRVRGALKTAVFEKDTISAVGGQVIVGNSSMLILTMESTDTSFTVEDSVFSLNDVIVIRDGVNREYMQVTNIASAPTYTVTRDLAASYTPGELPTWESGTTVASTGHTGTGYLVLDATSDFAPFIDINYRNSSVWDDFDTKVRLGNLSGITDPDLGTLSGFGLYSDNVYLKGTLWAETIKTEDVGSRIYMDTDKFIAYDDDENEIFQIFMDNPPSGYGVGDIVLGDYENDNGILWDASTGTLWIRGLLDADDISTGGLSVSYLQSGTAEGMNMLLDSASFIQSTNFPAIGYGWKLGGEGSIYMILPNASGTMGESYLKSENYSAGSAGWDFQGGGSFELLTASYTPGSVGWRLDSDGSLDIRIDQLTDVVTTSPLHRECLFYDYGTSQWKNRYPNAVYADDLAPSSSSSSSSSSSNSSSSSSSSSVG